MEIELWRPPPLQPQYVANFINSIERVKTRKKILSAIERLRDYELQSLLRTQDVKKIKDGLFELRVSYDGQEFRIFFCTYKARYWLLHGFIKKQQQTPLKEIETAENRMNELKSTQ